MSEAEYSKAGSSKFLIKLESPLDCPLGQQAMSLRGDVAIELKQFRSLCDYPSFVRRSRMQ